MAMAMLRTRVNINDNMYNHMVHGLMCPSMLLHVPHSCSIFRALYHNTIAGSPLGERIFHFFEKIRFTSQKLNFSNLFLFLAKKVKIALNNLEVTKCCKN